MAFGNKRRKHKKGNGLVERARRARARKKKLEQRLKEQEKSFEAFARNYPDIAECILQIRAKAEAGYQSPEARYDSGSHSRDLIKLALKMGGDRKKILRELNCIYSRKSTSTVYLALSRAASVPDFDIKTLSKLAQKVKKAVKDISSTAKEPR